jgi:CBS domain-containing protein
MLGLPVGSVIEPRKLVVAAPDSSVSEAACLMQRGNVGAVLVVENERLVGIFTERDVLFRVVAKDLDPKQTPLSAVMTSHPLTVTPDETFGYALILMHANGFRHLPVIEGNRPVGVVSARHALDPDLEEFAVEAERRNAILRRA